MNLTLTEQQQQEMRHAHYDGAPGVLVSGLIWIVAALICYQLGIKQGVWTLLIGGALIYPISVIFSKALGRPATTDKSIAQHRISQNVDAIASWLSALDLSVVAGRPKAFENMTLIG